MRIREIIGNLYRQKAVGALLTFAVGMTIMAGLSRIADSFMMPRVIVGAFQEMSLNYPVEIQGTIEAKGFLYVYGMENLRVGEILVEADDMVSKGDVLFRIDKKDLADKMEGTEREIENITLQLEELKNNYESQVKERNKRISRAREDYEDTANSVQRAVDAAYLNIENARAALDEHENHPPTEMVGDQEKEQKDETSVGKEEIPADEKAETEDAAALWEQKKAELNQNYLQMEQQYEEAVLSGNETLKNASRLLEDAEAEITKDNSSSLSLEMELEELKKSLEEMAALKEKDGKVYADADGKISGIHVSVGSVVGTEPAVVMEDSRQAFQFEGEFDSLLSPFVKEGQQCEIMLLHENKKLENVKIKKVSVNEAGIYKVTADLSSEEVRKSGEGVLTFTKTSKVYWNCIPLSALFQESEGYYILAAAETVTILGVQTTAVKIPVGIAEQNGEYAAVEGNFSGYGAIIVNADKAIKDGDRIRVMEGL